MHKWYQVLVQDLDVDIDKNLKDLDENLAWLTQKTEDPKGIKQTLLSPHIHTVAVIELNCKVIKKWQPPSPLPFLHQPLFRFIPLFLAQNFVAHPQVTQFLEGCTPGRGGFRLWFYGYCRYFKKLHCTL